MILINPYMHDGGGGPNPVFAYLVGRFCPSLDATGNGTTTNYDSSAVGNNATLQNMTGSAWGVDTGSGGVRAISYDDTAPADYLVANHQGQITSANEFAVSVWAKDTVGKNPSTSRYIWRELSNNNALYYHDRVGFSPALYWSQRGGFGGPAIVSSTALAVGSWSHIVGNYKSGLQQLWVNGSLVGSATTSFTLPVTSASTIRIGEGWIGKIDDLCLFSKILTMGEIATLFAGQRGLAA